MIFQAGKESLCTTSAVNLPPVPDIGREGCASSSNERELISSGVFGESNQVRTNGSRILLSVNVTPASCARPGLAVLSPVSWMFPALGGEAERVVNCKPELLSGG